MGKLVAVLMLLMLTLPAMAQDAPPVVDYSKPAKTKVMRDRRGIVLGVGAGVGEQILYYNSYNRNNIVPMVDLKLGYGVTDKILVLFNPSMVRNGNDGWNVYTFNFSAASQFYVVKDFYLRPGFGASFSTHSYDSFMRAQYLMGKVSFGADMAAGYEFRFLNGRLGLSPELVYHFSMIPSGYNTIQSNTIGLQLSVLNYIKIK